MKNKANKSKGRQTSARKAAANKLNAQKSTGPQGAAGKAKSSQNALKHGFYSKGMLLPSEDPAAFHAFQNEIWAGLAPENYLEALNVAEVVHTLWRLQRLGLVEQEVFLRQSISFAGKQFGLGFAFVNDARSANTFSKLAGYEAGLSRRLHRAMTNLRLSRENKGKESRGFDETKADACVVSEPVDAVQPQATKGSAGSTSVQEHTAVQAQPQPVAEPASVSSTAHDNAAAPGATDPKPAPTTGLGSDLQPTNPAKQANDPPTSTTVDTTST